MNKGVVVGGLVLLGALAWLLMSKPDPQPTRAVPEAKSPVVAPAAVPDASTLAAKPKRTPDARAAATPVADAAAVEPDGPVDTGPWTVDLGEHRIHLKERDRRVIEIHAKLTTDSALTVREIRGRRRALVRMMFFLGTHRAADGAASDVGGERFRKQLEERYRNVIKTGPFELVIDRFEVFRLPPKDAGP